MKFVVIEEAKLRWVFIKRKHNGDVNFPLPFTLINLDVDTNE